MNAGRHVVVEKPFALSVAECDRMIAAARKNQVALSCFHNRHWDSNILTIMKNLPRIGRPFRWESRRGVWGNTLPGWRSDKKFSGGMHFDWGVHFVEWMLQAMAYDMWEISGFVVADGSSDANMEDEVHCVVRFANGAVGTHIETIVSAHTQPMIRICGAKGTLVSDGFYDVTLHTVNRTGRHSARKLPMVSPRRAFRCKNVMVTGAYRTFYENVFAHVLRGAKLIITPEWARRVVQVLDYASRSARRQRALQVKYR